MPRIKKTETQTTQAYENELSTTPAAADASAAVSQPSASETPKPKRTRKKASVETSTEAISQTADAAQTQAKSTAPVEAVVKSTIIRKAPILTIDAYADVETPEEADDTTWHEIQNAFLTKKILTGYLDGLERLEAGNVLAVLHYKGFRVVMPVTEMYVNLPGNNLDRTDARNVQHRYLSMMLGAEIDFIVRGIDSDTKSVVGSRRDAMLKKRQTFYFDRDANGQTLIYPGRIVQGRVIAVTEQFIRVEVFGVDTNVFSRNLTWYWVSDVREYYSIGDTILLRVTSISGTKTSNIQIEVDAKSLAANTNRDNLRKCRIQGKYTGKVVDVRRGVIYVRLSNGTNAIAHFCQDFRIPGKKDDVSFVVTRLEEEHNVAIGIVTRIIRQNL
ncbi:MAG: S1 RNA-binding domain-containing protein [Oscillospiraceae bacterium]|nr:S1 RNA-binding domain-containing protein [Oscillospiraceae bacterium]